MCLSATLNTKYSMYTVECADCTLVSAPLCSLSFNLILIQVDSLMKDVPTQDGSAEEAFRR